MFKKERSPEGIAPFRDKLNNFMRTPIFIIFVMLLSGLSNALGLELIAYTVLGLAAAYTCIFGLDLLPLIPLMMGGFLALSAANNPGQNPDSVLTAAGTSIYLTCIAVLVVGSILYRIIRDRRRYLEKKYVLMSGMVVLSVAYILGGIGSNGYAENALRSIFFAFLNGVAIMMPYVLFSGNVHWDRTRKDYLIWTGFGVGCLLLFEIAWIYYTGEVIVDGIIHRKAIYTGWGMYNNIGATLAMTIPFPFYLATKYRKGWIGTFLGSLFLIGVLLTCSRTSIFCGCAIYFVCVLLMLYYANNKKANTLTLIFFTGSAVLLLLLFKDQILYLFSSLIERGLDSSNRDDIYRDGLSLFKKYPIFGGSFFSTEYVPWAWSTNAGFTDVFPPRWHNTYVQLLASCGVVGFLAYGFHRWQTAKLFIKNPSPEKAFTACSIIVLLTTSLFDCHFFNIGPVLFYSMALAFAENATKD